MGIKDNEMEWEDVNNIIKRTLENAKHLEPDDTYLIEKATDNCHLLMMKSKLTNKVDADPCTAHAQIVYRIHGAKYCKDCGNKLI